MLCNHMHLPLWSKALSLLMSRPFNVCILTIFFISKVVQTGVDIWDNGHWDRGDIWDNGPADSLISI